MTEDVAEWLLTEDGRAQADAAARWRAERAETLTALTRLRKAAPPERAAAAWELAELRERGQAKFGPDAAQMFFVREALEQASSRRAAAYHARRLAQAGAATVADVCGGIGGDALAFARAGLRVTLYERDPVRARFAAENARALEWESQVAVVCADVAERDVRADAVWFDPARRSARGRANDPEEYQPPLSLLRQWQAQGVSRIGVKLAPAIDHAVAGEYGAALEFVSDGGECKEGLLWIGPPAPNPVDRPDAPSRGRGEGESDQVSLNPLPSEERTPEGEGRVRGLAAGVGEGRVGASPVTAVLLTDAGEHRLSADPEAAVAVAGAQGGRVLYEPDPAVIRAHGVATLAGLLDARVLHPQIAYLVAEEYRPTPFATAYDVIERLPYSRRKLQEALTRRGVGQVVIKKRGFPQEPDAVRRELTLRGAESLTVVLTRAAGGAGHQVILCRPVAGR